jgi:hypothetical protein
MTYYSDIKFFNGLPISSLFCYTALLCLHQCLLHSPCAFYSFSFYALCAMSLQCTIPLLCISTTALCLLLHTSITLNRNHPDLFFVLHSYSLCAPCACNMHQPPTCSPPPTVLHIEVFFALSFSTLCRVLYLIIIATLQLLWRFHPCVHHHWVLY